LASRTKFGDVRRIAKPLERPVMKLFIDGAERDRRERKLGAVVGGCAAIFGLGIPLLGWLIALMITGRMCAQAYINSSSRALDILLSLFGFLAYGAIVVLTFFIPGKNSFLMCVLPAAWGAIWLWIAQARFSFFD
tara:strand:- start:846 stop:1250 length:405 start_codon:yes stop_codon:yes gene_type:complete